MKENIVVRLSTSPSKDIVNVIIINEDNEEITWDNVKEALDAFVTTMDAQIKIADKLAEEVTS